MEGDRNHEEDRGNKRENGFLVGKCVAFSGVDQASTKYATLVGPGFGRLVLVVEKDDHGVTHFLKKVWLKLKSKIN